MSETPTFDRDAANDALLDHMRDRVGLVEVFHSVAEGVVAFERLDNRDRRKVDFDGLARELSDKLGLKVLNIANCDWTFDDRPDEEATFIAFDVPGLDKGYAETWRTELSEAYLETIEEAPSAPSP